MALDQTLLANWNDQSKATNKCGMQQHVVSFALSICLTSKNKSGFGEL